MSAAVPFAKGLTSRQMSRKNRCGLAVLWPGCKDQLEIMWTGAEIEFKIQCICSDYVTNHDVVAFSTIFKCLK